MKKITIFPWDDNFNTGIEKIDKQHKKLVNIINDLATQFTYSAEKINLNTIFDELLDYTDYHFNTEETIWNKYLANTKSEKKHKIIHAKFIDTVKGLIDSQKEKSHYEVAKNTLGILVHWLVEHILVEDRLLAYTVLNIQSKDYSKEEARQIATQKIQKHQQTMLEIILKVYDALSNNILLLMQKIQIEADLKLQYAQQSTFFQTIINTLPNLIWLKDKEGKYLTCNTKFEQLCGMKKEQIEGKTAYDFFTQKLAASLSKSDVEALKSNSSIKNTEWVTFLNDGHQELMEIIKAPLYDVSKNVIGVLGIGHDITIRTAETRRLEYALRGSSDGLWDWNMDNNEVYFSPRYFEMLGYKEDELPGHLTTFENLLHPKYKAAVYKMADDYIKGKRNNFSIEFEMQHKNGSWVWILARAKLATNKDGTLVQPMRMVGTHVDITQRKNSEKKLAEAALVFHTTSEAILFADKEGLILEINPAFTTLMGYTKDEAINQKTSILRSGQHSKEFYANLWDTILHKGSWKGEIWNKTKNGDIVPQLLSINSIKNENGHIEKFLALFTDISKLKQKEAELNYLAHHDPLTGLPNRTLLQARLEQTLSSAKRQRHKTALFYLDLDNFKSINDSFGHPIGDQLLLEATKRVQNILREEDTFARVGGDEFIIVLSGIRSLNTITKKLDSIIALLEKPFLLDTDKEIYSSISIGVSIAPNDASSSNTLIKNADIALYKAKRAGKNMYKFFHEDSCSPHKVTL